MNDEKSFEIPWIDDVLYALRLNETQKYYNAYQEIHPWYLVSVHLAASYAVVEVHTLKPYIAEDARKIIARVVINLTPPEHRCLYRDAFRDAKRTLGEIPADVNKDNIEKLCGCKKCIPTEPHAHTALTSD